MHDIKHSKTIGSVMSLLCIFHCGILSSRDITLPIVLLCLISCTTPACFSPFFNVSWDQFFCITCFVNFFTTGYSQAMSKNWNICCYGSLLGIKNSLKVGQAPILISNLQGLKTYDWNRCHAHFLISNSWRDFAFEHYCSYVIGPLHRMLHSITNQE